MVHALNFRNVGLALRDYPIFVTLWIGVASEQLQMNQITLIADSIYPLAFDTDSEAPREAQLGPLENIRLKNIFRKLPHDEHGLLLSLCATNGAFFQISVHIGISVFLTLGIQ